MAYTTLFFDLDDTLYPPSNGLWTAIRERITSYMHDRLGIAMDDIPHLRQSYLETYGTALRGLQHFYPIDTDDYLAYVHDLPLKEFIQPNPALRRMLQSLPQKCWIFTNADDLHAARVLEILGITDCFEGTIDVRKLGFLNKPNIEAHHLALDFSGEKNPKNCVILDDSWRNMVPAQELGMTTVLVSPDFGNNGTSSSKANYWMNNILDLPQTMPHLWQADHTQNG